MVIVSCSGKFHAFNLVEQLARQGQLSRFYTRYAYQRNSFLRRLVSRVDREAIPIDRLRTVPPLAIAAKLGLLNAHVNNDLFDRWVAGRLARQPGAYTTFVGWSGMALRSIRQAKADGRQTIVERGSSHILHQNQILREEYARFGRPFAIDPRVIDKELQEYDEADRISIPSEYVRQTFLEHGVRAEKLFVNSYGASAHFQAAPVAQEGRNPKFTIVYLGSLTVRKGLVYLFRALRQLPTPERHYNVWFIGQVANEVRAEIRRYQRPNWTFFGHVDHYRLASYLRQASVGVQPSVDEGLSMVIPQMMACGLPVVATTNTGAADLIEPGRNGFIVPIRDPRAIAHYLTELYEQPDKLAGMQQRAADQQPVRSWEAYGRRYVELLNYATQPIDSLTAPNV